MTSTFSLDFVRHDHTEIDNYLHPCKIYKKGGRSDVEYLNISTAFDIEATSFFRHRETGKTMDVKKAEKVNAHELRTKWEKISIMYAWVYVYDGHAFTGRTWEEFLDLILKVERYHGLSDKRFMVCVVHNLAYEFNYIRKRFPWANVFAVKERSPVYARTCGGIEFRCSLILSGYSLAKVGEHLETYRVAKMTGDLCYETIRHAGTPLTETEWNYIVHDGLVACAYFQELIEKYKRIVWIPITKTGFVRKHLRRKCFFTNSSHQKDTEHRFESYRRIMNYCIIDDVKKYQIMKQSFMGGIVHANDLYSGILVEDAQSMDITSSYPTQLVIGQFPYGAGEWVHPKSKQELSNLLRKKCCFIDVSFHNIEKSQNYESIISRNKCVEQEGFEEDNGRLIRADRIRMSITEIDLAVYKSFYKWERMEIHKMLVYEKKRLPTPLVKAILELYAKKTELKGVEGMESEYQHAKELLNSVYGCMVTDIIRDQIVYEGGEWKVKPCDMKKELDKYNKSKTRFSFYGWGCYDTALARRALCCAIVALKEDYIYSDTDSVKYRNPEKHKGFFERYNRYIMNELRKASEYHNIPLDMFMPKSKDGVCHPLGVWDFDGKYSRFKTLGAKRYAVEYPDGHHSLTIAGVNKRTAIPYLEEHEEDFFDFMHFGYLFNEECCGKKLHTYIDDERSGELVDYLGNVGHFDELSSVHLMSTTYRMTAPDDYLDMLDFIHSNYMIV